MHQHGYSSAVQENATGQFISASGTHDTEGTSTKHLSQSPHTVWRHGAPDSPSYRPKSSQGEPSLSPKLFSAPSNPERGHRYGDARGHAHSRSLWNAIKRVFKVRNSVFLVWAQPKMRPPSILWKSKKVSLNQKRFQQGLNFNY